MKDNILINGDSRLTTLIVKKTITNKRNSTIWLFILVLILNCTACFSQEVKLDVNELETTMRNPMTYDRGQNVLQWLILGNIPAKWNEGIDKDFLSKAGSEATIRPREGQSVELVTGTKLTWKKLQNPAKIIDIADFCKDSQIKDVPVENIVRYAYGIINRPKAGKAFLTMGSDDGIKVWLNGKLIYRNMVYRSVAIDQDFVEVDLNKGDNYLLFKTVQTAWGKFFTTCIADDANVPENTVQKIQMTLSDNKKESTISLKTEPLAGTITKQQAIHVNVYAAGGQSVFENTIQRGDSISMNYTNWADGAYEIKYVYSGLTGLSTIDYLNWFKGDALKFARDLVKTVPEKNAKTAEDITHRMLADFINYRIDGNFATTDQYKISLLHPLLMEFAELKAHNQVRPGGFIRLAYVDEIDGTPQFCRCYIPSNYDPSKKSALIVFLHGYNPDNPDYVRWWSADKRHDMFVDRYNYILIEPHGRGNTQYMGIGDRDVVKCIQMAKEKLNIDNDRVYLTGESMGGGGTWRIASVHPELFAAIAPVYGGWDYHSTMKKDELKELTEAKNFLLEKTYTTSQFEALLNLPILALHGDNDKTVDVENSRYLVRMLQRWGYDIRYIEVPGKGHENLGKGDVIYPWLLRHTRNKAPKQVRVRAADLRTASAYWVKVTQRNNGWQMMNVEAEILENNIIRVNSDNVLELILSPDESLIQFRKPVNVIWNGKILTFDNLTDNNIILQSKELVLNKIHKNSQIAGPISDFTNTPFALVVGTISKDSLMQKVIKFKTDAFVAYWKNSQKFEPRIFKDTEIDNADLKNYSLFLLGGPKENKISQQISKSIPFNIKPETITIQGTVFQAPKAVLEAIYPSPFNAERYIRLVAPTSFEGLFFYDPNNVALSNYDYTILDGRITNPTTIGSEKNIGIASGLFDYNWKIEATDNLSKGDGNTSSNCIKRVVDKNFRVEITTTVIPTVEVLNSYKGNYKFEQMDTSFEILMENNELLLYINGMKFITKALSNSEFYIGGFDAVISFQKDKQTNMFYINFYQGTNRMKCLKILA